jgi:hypothetical protein
MSASGGGAAQWRSTVPLYTHLGFTLDHLDDGRSRLRPAFRPRLGNSRGEDGALACRASARYRILPKTACELEVPART